MREIKKVAVIAHGYGYRGYSGEGKVYLEGVNALKDHNLDYILVTFSKLNINDNEYVVPFKFRRFDKYQRLLVWFAARRIKPLFFLNLSGVPIPLSKISPHIIYAGAPAISSAPTKYSSSLFWKAYLFPFKIIAKKLSEEAKKSYIIANSFYSLRKIEEAYNTRVRKVIYPPVDVDFYKKAFTEKRSEIFLSIGRIEKGKMLENSIKLSAKSGIKGIIIGSLGDRKYLEYLYRLVKELEANIEIYTDLASDKILEIMKIASVYFHPTIGEHFGIPVIESMSAGLIPIVPRESGSYEIVPEYSYNNLDEASSLLKNVIYTDIKTRKELSEKADFFNSKRFKDQLYAEISNFIK
ncbi:glycosyltransferase [Acidianus brierleyi]|uniref:Glycosyl transferase family 1 n=1 Tax=Acidianus brierleyi TaxID=41673 RepID=A0A2U9IFH4_9CREN|nr:glycosyltransferase [Acidianus brierleyi]AWR94715.1 glycosyltransferase [Acidianus brierleyi]